VPLNKEIFILRIVIVFVLITTTGSSEVHAMEVVRPALKMEVVEIPSKGKVAFIDGDAEILNKEKSAGYQVVELGTIISDNDILWVKPGCIIKIKFEDDSYIFNKKQQKESFITFKFDRIIEAIKINNFGTTLRSSAPPRPDEPVCCVRPQIASNSCH
jgi:hypothetical protein